MFFVTDVLIGGSFADWFAHYSLDKKYNFDPSFGPKISPDHVSCDAKIFNIDEVLENNRKKLGMDSADPQNRSEWRGHLRERLVKKPNPR